MQTHLRDPEDGFFVSRGREIGFATGNCFFFNDPPTTEIYTLSLHDALPIYHQLPAAIHFCRFGCCCERVSMQLLIDRKSTRLNSSHVRISYAVFCLKNK